jgi:hypothetical protein
MTIIASIGSLASFLAIWKVIKNRNYIIEQEGEEAHKAKYGDLFDKLHGKSILSAYWNLLMLLRWIITVVIMICLRDHPNA